MMFAFLSYNGAEPGWAKGLRESNVPGFQVYSPAALFKDQFPTFEAEFLERKPNARAYAHADALRLEKSLWMPINEAQATLEAADSCILSGQMVWRDLYLLTRSDALIVDTRSTNEMALFASLLGIPIVAISYGPTGLHPWLSHCAKITINSPGTVAEILGILMPRTPDSPQEEQATPNRPDDETSGE